MTGALPSTVGGPFRVVVAGAGVAGLACVHRLLALARERGLPLRLTVLEAESRPGGVIITDRVDGCVIEGGPDCFVSDKPWGLDLCRRAGLADEIVGTATSHRRSFVYMRGRLLPIPEGYQLLAPRRMLPFTMTPILSLRGKLRAACDLVLPRGPRVPDESLASFVRRRFGQETLERLAQPLLAGIYNADPERLSLRATMPRFPELERRHRSVILGLLRGRRGAPAAARSGVSGARYSIFVTLRMGLQTLTDRLAAALPRSAWPTAAPTFPTRSTVSGSWCPGARTGGSSPARSRASSSRDGPPRTGSCCAPLSTEKSQRGRGRLPRADRARRAARHS